MKNILLATFLLSLPLSLPAATGCPDSSTASDETAALKPAAPAAEPASDSSKTTKRKRPLNERARVWLV